MYKIRISTSEDSNWKPDWFLDKITMEHTTTKQILSFPCNRYASCVDVLCIGLIRLLHRPYLKFEDNLFCYIHQKMFDDKNE